MKSALDDLSWERLAAVVPAGEAECVCIQVEHPSQCYVTDGGIVTHNSTGAEGSPQRAQRGTEEEGGGRGGVGLGLGHSTSAEHIAAIGQEGELRRMNEDLLAEGKLDRKAPQEEGFFRNIRAFLVNAFAGRYDRLEFYAPGVRAAIENNQFDEAYATAAINQMMRRVKNDLFAAFGDPKFWSKQRRRLERFLDQLLPVAARLEAEGVDGNGDFIWKAFEMRTGTIPMKAMAMHNFKAGQQIRWGRANEVLVIGPKVPDREAHVLLRPMTVETQQQVYEWFKNEFPEGIAVLDQFIMPDMRDAVHVGPGNVSTAAFNRGALLKLFNEWPAELQAIFGQEPLPGIHGIAGYTPDVAAQKTLGAFVSSLLNRFASAGRKFKAGELRESGNVKNLLDGFSTRAMEAHREKIRLLTRRELIQKAAKPKSQIDPLQLENWVEIDDTFAKLYEAVVIGQKLPRDKYPALAGALNPAQRALLSGLLGDLWKLRGSGQMVHKVVHKELMLSLAMERTENTFLRVLEWLLDRLTKGLLGPSSYMVNWTSNEILKLMALMNRFNFAVVSALTGDGKAAKLGAYEFMHLVRGFFRDRLARWQKRITDVVPEELLAGSSGMAFLEDPNDRSALDELARLDPGGAFLKGIGYGNIDVNAKLAMIYRALQAQAEIEWGRLESKIKIKSKKGEWVAEWMRNAHRDNREAFRRAVRQAMFWFMDYANVPAWVDPSQSTGQLGRTGKKAFFPFMKWGVNMIRQAKAMTWGAAGDLFLPGSNARERREAAAKLMTMAGLTALGAVLNGGDDDEPVVGSSVDEEGDVLDASLRTGNRMNVSRIARMIHEWAAQYGVPLPGKDYTIEGADGFPADIFVRYRNFPYLREMVLLGFASKGNFSKMWEQSAEMLGEYASFGIATKLFPMTYQLSPFDRDKSYPYVATEAMYDLLSAPLLPPWARDLAVAMFDPVQRRSKKLESWHYDPGAWEAILASTPGASHHLPPAGEPVAARPMPFDAAEWYRNQVKKIAGDKELVPQERKASLDALAQEYRAIVKLPLAEQRKMVASWGFPMAKWDESDTQATFNVAGDLAELRRLEQTQGVDLSSGVREVERKTTNSRTGTVTVKPGIGYVPAKSLSVRPRRDELLKQFTGVNLKRVKSSSAAVKREFFGK